MRVKQGDNPRRKLAKKKAVAKKSSGERTETEGERTETEGERTRGKNRDFHDPDRAKDRCRATVVEEPNFDEHPVDQHMKGTRFHHRLQRAMSRAEGLGDKPRANCKLTHETVDDIYRIMREGLTQQHAESFLGLSERAIENWNARGKRDMGKLKAWRVERKKHRHKGWDAKKMAEVIGDRPEQTVHMYLRSKVLKAEKFGEATLFGSLVDAALGGDAMTGKWLLERRWPHLYGRFSQRRDLDDVSGDDKKSDGHSSAQAILAAVGSALSED